MNNRNLDEDFFNRQLNRAKDFSNCGAYDKCYETLKALVECGYSCPLDWERFAPLKDLEGFESLKKTNNKIIDETNQHTAMRYFIDYPENYSNKRAYPLLIILHGDGSGSNMNTFRNFWKPYQDVRKKFLNLYIQSSQFLYSFNYGWLNDPDKARRDIRKAFEEIGHSHPIKRDSVIIGGFSGGAITAIDIALSETIPVKGFISICPVMKPESFSMETVISAKNRNLKGVFIEGENEIPVQAEEDMICVFQKAGMAYQYYINNDAGHDIPEALEGFLQKSLVFIRDSLQ